MIIIKAIIVVILVGVVGVAMTLLWNYLNN